VAVLVDEKQMAVGAVAVLVALEQEPALLLPQEPLTP
jgi:hypothetical protein